MSAVIELSAVRALRLQQAFNRAFAQARGLGYGRLSSQLLAGAVRKLIERGMGESEARKRVIRPKDAPVFDPTRPAA